jgi:hypothetical protein
MKRQAKRIGEIVLALSELNLPRESRSLLLRCALEHRNQKAKRGRILSLEAMRRRARFKMRRARRNTRSLIAAR